MTALSERDTKHVFEKLRTGLVPERGLDSYAVGIDKELAEIDRQLRFVRDAEGQVKFLRGDYGCGKTFMARLAVERAQHQGFATSFVVVSPNDLKFHRFDEVYNKVVTGLGTASCERQALGDIIDRWIGSVEEALLESGVPEDDDFDDKVAVRIREDLARMMGGTAPPDFVRVIETVFDLKQKGEIADANVLLSWLGGSGNVGAAVKKKANIKGEITSKDAMDYLRGVVQIVKEAGYSGLLIVIDEAETILRMRSDSRHKSLNGIRQITDAAGQYPGLLWLFTGTPDFFDSRKGVAGLPALHDRIRFEEEGGFASRRQPQLRLVPFKRERLLAVAKQLRELYVPLLEEEPDPSDPLAERRQRHETLLSARYLETLVDAVTEGFRGDVGIVPRQFLRKLINNMDLVRDNPDFDPMKVLEASGFKPEALSPEEQARLDGTSLVANDGDDGLVPAEDVW